jgi:hypothetical protein
MESEGMQHVIMTNLPSWTVMDMITVGGTLCLVYLVGKECIKLGTSYFFNKAVGTDYVTLSACAKLRAECEAESCLMKIDHEKGIQRRSSDVIALKHAVSAIIEYNKDIPVEKREAIRNSLMSS